MSATRPRLAARSRWSAAVKCPRQAAYGLLGIPPEEERLRDDVAHLMRLDLDGLRRRGRRLGAVRAHAYIDQYGEDNVELEREVAWPAGILHEDIFVRPEALAVEVKSVTPASIDTIFDAAVLQVAGAVHFDDEAEHGMVEFVSPLDESVYECVPVTLNDDLIARVEAVAHAVAQAGMTKGAELPERVCQRPGDSAGRLCPFAGHCFDGWAEQHPPIILDDPEVVALCQSLHTLKSEYKTHSAEAKLRSEGYAEVQARLAELGVEPGVDYEIGPFRLRRIVTAEGESFSLAKARSAGAWTGAHDEHFSAFLKPRAGSERWTIDRVSDEIVAGDWGDDAPWSGEDL